MLTTVWNRSGRIAVQLAPGGQMLGFRVVCLMRRLIMVMIRGMLMTRLGHILIAGPCLAAV